MKYFAYGSNMDPEQIKARCPSATFVSKASLPSHKLEFTRKSIKRGCGVADVLPDETAEVWGVIYEIDDKDVDNLNECEGYNPSRAADDNAYNPKSVTVLLDGSPTKPESVSIYLANSQPNPPLPNQTYKDHIVNGAKSWDLPADYVADLEKIKVQP